MNRRDRRSAAARGNPIAGAAPADTARLFAEANQAYRGGQSARAEALCNQILARAAAHVPCLNLLGLIYQSSGRHRLAVKMFARAIAVDGQDAACHYNIASSYQLLEQRAEAAAHFKEAIALGLSGQNPGDLVMHNPDILECTNRAMEGGSLPAARDDLFGERDIAAIANDIFLRCVLQSTPFFGVPLEFFLTHLRVALLRRAQAEADHSAKFSDDVVAVFCALAQQFFINEYAYTQSDREQQHAGQLRDLLLGRLTSGSSISPVMLAAVAAYFPLYSLPGAQALLAARWPDCAADLLRQQIREPLQEAEDRRSIAALTPIDDDISIQVMQQYEESPYPRWTINPVVASAGRNSGSAATAGSGAPPPRQEILIAACGTGRHAFQIAQQSPEARILAVDLSRASLAYARRKTQEAGLRNIEYAQADILKLATIGRSFDHIEAVGVLHHLAEPERGWRTLLSLLKPKGTMRVGLYSEAARRAIVEARQIIAERGYPVTAEGIRALRQWIIGNCNEPHWKTLLGTAADFYSMSGCRDMFFNVMEHRFTIPEIAAFLKEHGLSFLGFELDDGTIATFKQQYPGAQALTNLDYWNAFETANPQTFLRMYAFSVTRTGASSL
jgi:ubiquinone/menaquinone biosynthesis C-methylase UbiE